MILTDESCDKLCAAAREKAKSWVLTLALQSPMKADSREYIGDMARFWY